MKLNKILRHDLLKHFFVGFFLFTVTGFVFSENIAFFFVFLIGLGKEIIWDHYLKKGTFDVWDFVYTVLPATILILLK